MARRRPAPRARSGRVVPPARDRRAGGPGDARHARGHRRPAARRRVLPGRRVLGDALPARALHPVRCRGRVHRRRLCVVGGGRDGRGCSRPPRGHPLGDRPARRGRAGLRAGPPPPRLLPQPPDLGRRREGDPRLRPPRLAPRPVRGARARRRPAGLEGAAAVHLRPLSHLGAGLAAALGRRDRRRGPRGGRRRSHARRAGLRAPGNRARRVDRDVHGRGRLADRARPARVPRARAVRGTGSRPTRSGGRRRGRRTRRRRLAPRSASRA